MVLGLKYRHYESENNEQKSRAYAVATEYTKCFREQNGSIVCRDLLGYDLTKLKIWLVSGRKICLVMFALK